MTKNIDSEEYKNLNFIIIIYKSENFTFWASFFGYTFICFLVEEIQIVSKIEHLNNTFLRNHLSNLKECFRVLPTVRKRHYMLSYRILAPFVIRSH